MIFPALIERHPSDCQCSDCMAGHTDWTNRISILATTHTPAVNSRGVSVSPPAQSGLLAETPPALSPSGGGNVRTGHPSNSKLDEAGIYAAARKVIVKEILNLLGRDMPSPRLHAKYLETIPFADLCARRDQIKRETLPMKLDLNPRYGGDQ